MNAPGLKLLFIVTIRTSDGNQLMPEFERLLDAEDVVKHIGTLYSDFIIFKDSRNRLYVIRRNDVVCAYTSQVEVLHKSHEAKATEGVQIDREAFFRP